jgi:hypothetical protein
MKDIIDDMELIEDRNRTFAIPNKVLEMSKHLSEEVF